MGSGQHMSLRFAPRTVVIQGICGLAVLWRQIANGAPTGFERCGTDGPVQAKRFSNRRPRQTHARWKSLSGIQRTLLSLRAEGYELPEIEAITGIDRKVLSARLNRAACSLRSASRFVHRRAGSQS